MGAENSKGQGSAPSSGASRAGAVSTSATTRHGDPMAGATTTTTSPARQPCSTPSLGTTVAATAPAVVPTPLKGTSPSRPVAFGGGGGGPSFVSLPMSGSVPRYVDQHSMVYGAPGGFGGEGGGASPNTNTSISRCSGGHFDSPTSSQPRLVQSSSTTNHGDFMIGSPVTPLSPSRRHVPALSHPVSTPIAIPTYSNNTEEDAGACGSPVLKSYRQHSISTSRNTFNKDFIISPTSPKLVFSGSNPGAFSHGAAQGAVTSLLSSPPALTSAGGQDGAKDDGTGGIGAPIHQRYLEITGFPLGLENYGNTCYCNSVIQLLYHCPPLRLRLLELHEIYESKKGGVGFEQNTLLCHLSCLMAVMHKSNNRKDPKKHQLISPSRLLKAVQERNPVFDNNMQQDAHEFAMFILNDIMETESKMMTDPKNRAIFMEEGRKKKSSSLAFWRKGSHTNSNNSISKLSNHNDSFMLPISDHDEASKTSSSSPKSKRTKRGSAGADINVPDLSPLQSILQGQFGSLTACLECGNISARDEVFIDLSLETEQGSSLLHCLHHFGDPEYFYDKNKLRCDNCNGPACAAKTIHVQRLPEYALLVHLKRFRYDVAKQNFTKKADHVALPMTMDVEEYSTDLDELASGSSAAESPRTGRSCGSDSYFGTHKDVFKPADEATKRKLRGVAKHKARFALTGFVAHLGEGPSVGHYFTCVRYGPQLWRRFDDDAVSVMTERDVQQYFGVPINIPGVVTTTAYILLYERVA